MALVTKCPGRPGRATATSGQPIRAERTKGLPGGRIHRSVVSRGDTGSPVTPASLTTAAPKRIVRSVDRRVYDHLKQAIEDLGAASSFMRAPVRQAKDEARAALADFQQESLSPALREASIVLGERLEDIQIHEPALTWKPLLNAWRAVEREAGSEAWD